VLHSIKDTAIPHFLIFTPVCYKSPFFLLFSGGVHGVFDIEEIVDVLRRENLENICVVSLPPSTKYVDYIVVVTGKSKRHMTAVAEFIRKLYKRKRHPHDVIPRIEGEMSSDWMALDLGRYTVAVIKLY